MSETPEEPVVFTPRILKPQIRLRRYACPTCGGPHEHWWFSSTVPAPSCEERIRRGSRP